MINNKRQNWKGTVTKFWEFRGKHEHADSKLRSTTEMIGVDGIQNYDLSSSSRIIHLITDSFDADDIISISSN